MTTTLLLVALLAVAACGPPRCRRRGDALWAAGVWLLLWSSLFVLAVLSAR